MALHGSNPTSALASTWVWRAVTIALALAPLCAEESPSVKKIVDIQYVSVDGHDLRLDLYIPETVTRPALVVYIHGGAWRSGTKDRMPLNGLVSSGYAVASVDYRLSPVARFPAQIHDIKAAIRFLRARHAEYGFDASAIAIAGSSAGGHLAALVGVTNGHTELEGTLGDHGNESSDVQAIVAYYGASNLLTILQQSTPHGLSVRKPALELLLGAQPEEQPGLAKLASPVHHVDTSDPPLLLLHGDHDPQMPINQSHELQGAYATRALPVWFEAVHGAAHGGPMFYDEPRTRLVAAFLAKSIGKH